MSVEQHEDSPPTSSTDRLVPVGSSSRLRAERAVKSTAALVAEARELLEVREAKLREERERAVLRAAYREHCGKGEAKKSLKLNALVDALAEAFGID